MPKIIIIGGVAGGMSTAAKAKREDPDLTITVYERTSHISYSACGMPYHVAGRIPLDDLVARTPPDMAEEGVTVKVRHEVVGVDHDARTVRVKNLGTGETFEDAYDTLVLATGARAVLPDLPGRDLKGVHTLRRLEDAARIRESVGNAQRAVVMGGGYIGLEMAEAFREAGLTVALVEAERLLSDFDPVFSKLAEDELKAHGVTVHSKKKIAAFCGEDRVTGVQLSEGDDGEGETLPADVVLVAVGAAPNNELAKTLGLALGPQGAVLTGGRLETNVENVYAVGDVTAVTHLVSGRATWLPLGDTANKQGRVLGTILGGRRGALRGRGGNVHNQGVRPRLRQNWLEHRGGQSRGLPRGVYSHQNDRPRRLLPRPSALGSDASLGRAFWAAPRRANRGLWRRRQTHRRGGGAFT